MFSPQRYEIFHIFAETTTIMEDIKTPIRGKLIFQEAMKYGAILGAVTVGFEVLSSLLTQSPDGTVKTAAIITALAYTLRIAKTVVCIWMMVLFAKKLVANYDDVSRSHTFRLNMFTGLFSGIICAAYNLLRYKLMGNAEIEDALRESFSTIQANPDIQEELFNTTMSLLPVITFFSTLISCFLIGLLASLVISRSIPGRTPNPFE